MGEDGARIELRAERSMDLVEVNFTLNAFQCFFTK